MQCQCFKSGFKENRQFVKIGDNLILCTGCQQILTYNKKNGFERSLIHEDVRNPIYGHTFNYTDSERCSKCNRHVNEIRNSIYSVKCQSTNEEI